MKPSYKNQDSQSVIADWVESFSDHLYSWALYKTSSKEAAEDLVQDTFMSAFESLARFEGRSSPKSWLLAILNNKIADYHGKKLRDITMATTSKNDSEEILSVFFKKNGSGDWLDKERPALWNDNSTNLLDDDAFNKILLSCLGKLPERWYAAVQLKYLEEKKWEEICQVLNIAQTNFWQILHRAKLQLRKCLESNWFAQI